MPSENSPEGDLFKNRLRAFGEREFRTMAAFADKLGMKPPALQGYLSGRRNPGVELLRKLSALGFDSRSEIDSPPGELRAFDSLDMPGPAIQVRMHRVWMALGNPDHVDLSRRIGISITRAADLLAGSPPTGTEIALLLDEVTSVVLTLSQLPALGTHKPTGT